MEKSVNFKFFKMYQFFHNFRCILIDFSRIFEKTEIYRFFYCLQNKISQRLLVQITSEEVRLKALDLYFMTIKKFFILPQFPLIPGTIEEVSKIFLILPQSFLNCCRNQRGLRKDEENWNFWKIWLMAVRTHFLPCIFDQ